EPVLASFLDRTESAQVVIEFILPDDILAYPVDEWVVGSAPLGLNYPVAVRSLDRLRDPSSSSRARWQHNWQALQRSRPVGAYVVSASSRYDLENLAQSEFVGSVVLLDFRPGDDRPSGYTLRQLVANGVPAIAWPRASESVD